MGSRREQAVPVSPKAGGACPRNAAHSVVYTKSPSSTLTLSPVCSGKLNLPGGADRGALNRALSVAGFSSSGAGERTPEAEEQRAAVGPALSAEPAPRGSLRNAPRSRASERGPAQQEITPKRLLQSAPLPDLEPLLGAQRSDETLSLRIKKAHSRFTAFIICRPAGTLQSGSC